MGSIGGKASNLQKLDTIEGVAVPKWFVIPSCEMIGFLNQIDSGSEDIQSLIQNGSLSESLALQIATSIKQFKPNTTFAIRSSGVIEDSDQSSCAGLYDSFLNCKNMEEVHQAIKATWASAYNPRAPKSDRLMGVIVQEMIDAAVSGVATTKVLSNNYPGIQIAANYGMGESIVHGDVDVDGWIVHPTKRYVIEAVKGSKKFCYKPSKKGGLERIEIPEVDRNRFCLTLDEVHQIKELIQKIRACYGCDIDVEFALDADRNIYILQTRPLVKVSEDHVLIVDPEQCATEGEVARGLYSLPGAVSGRLVFVSNWEELSGGKIELAPDDIVLAYITTNTWSHYLAHIKALITREGSPSSHPILLCREKHVPCLIGITEGFEELIKLDGQVVTLDGLNKVVYEGALPLIESNLSQFDTVKVRGWPDLSKDLPHLIHNKMVIEDEGRYWRKTPTYPLTGFQLELNMKRFELIPDILGKNVKILSKAIDGYSCNEMVPYERYVALFNGFGVQEAIKFNQDHAQCLQDFLEDANGFDIPRFIETYARFRSYIWLGAALRSYAERQVDLIGIDLELPQIYLEECAKGLQAEIPELDTTMHEEIHRLAQHFKNQAVPQKVDDLDPKLYEMVKEIGSRYRFEHSISLDRPLDLNLVYQRILLDVKSNSHFRTNKRPMDRLFLPEYPEFVEWLRVSIWNRILQSDSHHFDAKVRMIVRPKFLKLGKRLVERGILDEPEQIFKCTFEQLKSYSQLP